MVLKRYGDSYLIELWGISTKHPDFIYKHKGFLIKEYEEGYWDFLTIDDTFIQWVAWIASQQLYEYQAIKVLNVGFQIYTAFPEDDIPKISDILKTHIITWENDEIYGEEIKS